MELEIVKYIRKFGLEKAISDFKLICRDDGERILLKYNQIESNMSLIEVQESRGLILDKKTLKVLCLPFYKFFNHGEGNAHKIDWATSKVLEKLDGSLITLYSYNGKWYSATSGMIEGDGKVNNKLGLTFNSLFMRTLKDIYGLDVNGLDRDYNYVFELTTPYNIVVKPHKKSSLTLLTIRNVNTLKEVSYEELVSFGKKVKLPVVKAYDLNIKNVGVLIRTFRDMPWTDEGYVVVDANHNRIKIKNPAYVAVHHTKNRTAEHAVMPIIKTNEVDEYIATFPDRKDEILKLQVNYNNLVLSLEEVWEVIKVSLPKNIAKKEQKKFAMVVFKTIKEFNVDNFSGLFFALKDGKVESVKEYLFNYDDKKLYNML